MVERTPKILIVDDDPRLRDLLRRYLGENGFNVLVSENGEAMKRLWVREHFDVLILDLMMPGEDGLAILKRLRAEKDMTPVIMLTARGEDVDRILGLELGADDYLGKPFNPRELLARIHAVFLGFEHVQRVGGFDVRSMLVQRVRNGKQQFVFGFGICLCKTLLCACGLIGLAAHRVEHLRTQFIAHKKQE